MKMQKNNIACNLTTLRQLNKFSQEEVAERIGVSRQAVAKWEAGQSVPDILNCDALAQLYDVANRPRGGTRSDCTSQAGPGGIQNKARRGVSRFGG